MLESLDGEGPHVEEVTPYPVRIIVEGRVGKIDEVMRDISDNAADGGDIVAAFPIKPTKKRGEMQNDSRR